MSSSSHSSGSKSNISSNDSNSPGRGGSGSVGPYAASAEGEPAVLFQRVLRCLASAAAGIEQLQAGPLSQHQGMAAALADLRRRLLDLQGPLDVVRGGLQIGPMGVPVWQEELLVQAKARIAALEEQLRARQRRAQQRRARGDTTG